MDEIGTTGRRIFSLRYFIYFAAICAIQQSMLHSLGDGADVKRKLEAKHKRGIIMMSDLLTHLDRKRIDKRTVTTGSTPSVSRRQHSLASKNDAGTNIAEKSNASLKLSKTVTRFAAGNESSTANMPLSMTNFEKKLLTTDKKKKKFKHRNNKKRRKRILHRGKISTNKEKKISKGYNTQLTRKSKLKKLEKKHRRRKWRKLLKAEKGGDFSQVLKTAAKEEQALNPVSSRYKLVRVPISDIDSPYRSTFQYPRFQRNKIFVPAPTYYDDGYYYDGYYDQQRKDVIPKPSFATNAERGSKKDTFYKEKGEKRTAYSPIVSAVQNLDQSEANLFDSLFSTSHETNRLNDNVGNELAGFVGSPSDLEVYTPTDTPGELYFEKDDNTGNIQSSTGNSPDLTQYFTHASHHKPIEADVDPSDVVDNEETLLSIVEKVIEKQKKKEKEKSKGKMQSSKEKPQNTFIIGDTGEVFNTGRPENDENEPMTVDKLKDFLSKQPKFEKKAKSLKNPKHQGVGNLRTNNSQSKAEGKTSKGQHIKTEKFKGHGLKVIDENQNKKYQQSMGSTRFKSMTSGQRVIVENVSPKDDQVLMESMKQANLKEDGKASKGQVENYSDVASLDETGMKKSVSKPGMLHNAGYTPNVIKEIVKEKNTEVVMGSRKNDAETTESQHGYEVKSSAMRDPDTGRQTINEHNLGTVSEVTPEDWFTANGDFKSPSNQAISGEKKDEDKPAGNVTDTTEKTADSEATKERATGIKETSNENEKEVKPKEDPKVVQDTKNGTTNDSGEKEDKSGAATTVNKVTELPEQKVNESNLKEEDWYTNEQAQAQQVATPPEVESFQPPAFTNRTQGWRIRDYFLDNNNASYWDQIRSAWTKKNGSEFVFNNRIQVNPNYNPNAPTKPPQIMFGEGVQMPVLPTITAPTGIVMPHGFANDEDDDNDDDDDDEFPSPANIMHQQQQQGVSVQQQQQQLKQEAATTPSYGLQYPWQWHNRRPKEGRYQGAHLQFHGRPTVPAFVVTTRKPPTVGSTARVTRPTTLATRPAKESKQVEINNLTEKKPTLTQVGQASEGGQPVGHNTETKEEQQEKPENVQGNNDNTQSFKGKHEENGKGQQEATVDATKEKGKKGSEDGGQKGKGQDDEGQKEKGQKDEGQMKGPQEGVQMNEESLPMEAGNGSNETSVDSHENNGNKEVISNGNSKESHFGNGSAAMTEEGRWSNGLKDDSVLAESMTHKNTTVRMKLHKTQQYGNNITSFTKPPQELPILNKPTTKSVQNFLPGIRPPSTGSNNVPAERKSQEYPLWTGEYVEHLRKVGFGGEVEDNAEASSKGVGQGEKRGKTDEESGKILIEESTRKMPYDENIKKEETLKGEANAEEAESKASFAYESNLLQKEETENAENRARVSDSPINRQAESINLIRQKTSASQNAAQRQEVFGGNGTNNLPGEIERKLQENGWPQEKSQAAIEPRKEQTSPFLITQGTAIKNRSGSGTGGFYIPFVFSDTESSRKGIAKFPNVGPTTAPKITSTRGQMALITEEYHHPTPKPLFPINMITAKILKSENKGYAPQKETSAPFSSNITSFTETTTQNISGRQPSYFQYQTQPNAYKNLQTTTESTTPSSTGYKTTDWAKAFTTTERVERYPAASQSFVAPAVANGPALVQYNNTPITVVEGRYQTDTATMRTTTSRMEPAQPYQNTYPSANNGVPSYAPPQGIPPATAYGTTSSVQNWNVPGGQNGGGKAADALSDSYLTKFGDQLNMEDLYWTDSTEEKEEICKQEKGTNEVVHVLCFGDSLTRGYYNKGKSHHPYTNKLQYLLNKLDTKKCYIVENEGKDGELAYEEMPKRLESVLQDGGTKYEWTVILGGTNDIYNKKKSKKATEAEITQNIISMHEIAKRHNSKSVAVTIPEVYCETQDTCQDAKQLREKVNYNIRNYAYQSGGRVVLVDLADMLQRSNVGRDMVGQFFEGGLHLKPRGYERMAIIIFEGLKRALS